MRFCCLGSGSKGNASLVAYKNTLLMIDCGFSMRTVIERMNEQQCVPEQLTAILVTHEHADHISGVASLAKKYAIPVYATRGTAKTDKLNGVQTLHWIDLDEPFVIDDIQIMPVTVPHDAHEPCQFYFQAGGLKLGIVTDLGSISEHVRGAFDGCHALLLEANHDVDMLMNGPYPASLKQRVASDWGHLNNQQAEQFVCSLNLAQLNTLVLGHISEKNNHIDKVKQCFDWLISQNKNVIYASQEQGFAWLNV